MSTPIIPLRRDPGGPSVGDASGARHLAAPAVTAFNRRELGAILSMYGRMVAAGLWRDYAIDHLRDYAVFSVFHRTTEAPLYRIEKHPKLQAKQGAYAVSGADGRILKRGHDLQTVLRVFDRKLMKVIDE